MTHALSDDEARIKLRELIGHIRVAMFVTKDPDGGLASPPMAVLGVEGNTVWFFTDVTSPKTLAIGQDPEILLAGANPSRQEYISVRGTARVVQDRQVQKEHGTEAARLWFPDGSGSPNLALISVEMTSVEYWGSPASGARFALGHVKALLTRTPPEMGQDAKLRFGAGQAGGLADQGADA